MRNHLPQQRAEGLGCLGITIALAVSVALWYFGWQLVRWAVTG